MSHGVEREQQVLAIDALIRDTRSDLPRILMGDFNAGATCDEIRFLRGEHTLEGRRTYYQDAYATIHPGTPGATWSRRNPYTDRLAFLERDRRLDYIFVTQPTRDGRGTLHDAQLVLDHPTAGIFPSDHFGVLADIEI
jgi:endonuclease/exonuclease/phosphatase family metal-dependent hydrolase